MKQNPLPANTPSLRIALVIITLALFVSACAKLPPRASSVPSHLDAAKLLPGNAININTASVAELEELPGIGKGIAERIVAHRERYGQFRRAEHLMMVRGISDRKFRAIQPMIVVD